MIGYEIISFYYIARILYFISLHWQYIKQLRPTFSNILHLIRTVQYYPLHQNHFLKIANFLELIKTGYECIDYGIFMYHEQVVW